jgi:hypothetical protein
VKLDWTQDEHGDWHAKLCSYRISVMPRGCCFVWSVYYCDFKSVMTGAGDTLEETQAIALNWLKSYAQRQWAEAGDLVREIAAKGGAE